MGQLNANADKLLMKVGDVVTMNEPPTFLGKVEIVGREVDEEMVCFRVRVREVIQQIEGLSVYAVGDEFDLNVRAELFSMGIRVSDGSLVNSAMDGALWMMTRPLQAQTEAEA